jgi:hypothetical protein
LSSRLAGSDCFLTPTWGTAMLQEFRDFLSGKKTYIAAGLRPGAKAR